VFVCWSLYRFPGKLPSQEGGRGARKKPEFFEDETLEKVLGTTMADLPITELEDECFQDWYRKIAGMHTVEGYCEQYKKHPGGWGAMCMIRGCDEVCSRLRSKVEYTIIALSLRLLHECGDKHLGFWRQTPNGFVVSTTPWISFSRRLLVILGVIIILSSSNRLPGGELRGLLSAVPQRECDAVHRPGAPDPGSLREGSVQSVCVFHICTPLSFFFCNSSWPFVMWHSLWYVFRQKTRHKSSVRTRASELPRY